MKKIFALAFAVFMIAALTVGAAATDFSASYAEAPIVIDAVKDDAYTCEPAIINVPDDVNVAEDAEKGATGKGWMAWDSTNLYVYIEVEDLNITPEDLVNDQWMSDSVEVYVNPSKLEGSLTSIYAGQFTFGPSWSEGVFAGGGIMYDCTIELEYAWEYTETGYNIEAAIPWGDSEFVPAENEFFPFCIGINDDANGDPSGREYHNFTGPNQGNTWQTADANWDALLLTGGSGVGGGSNDDPTDTEAPDETEGKVTITPPPATGDLVANDGNNKPSDTGVADGGLPVGAIIGIVAAVLVVVAVVVIIIVKKNGKKTDDK